MPFDTLASQESVDKTVAGLKERGVEPIVVEDGNAALDKIKELIPKGASVMNGASMTLKEIGFVDYLKSGKHGWNNLHEAIVKEQDPQKQAELRKQALLSDYYLGSVHGLAETGEFVVASNTGSQLPHIVFSSPNLIFVVSTQKIVPTLSEAIERLEKHVIPLEDERMKEEYGVGTLLSKIVLFKHENPIMGRKVRLILVKEKLGF
ncbi:lactate utilization protein [Patescibacteria group bacterium]|nr:lactate utilization protein [Patescibacteria group bacterium]